MNLLGEIKGYMIIAGLLFSCPGIVVSQQLLLLNNGSREQVHVIYMHRDTLKYHLAREKYTLQTVLLDSVTGFGITTSKNGYFWDTIPKKLRHTGTTWQEIIFKNGMREKGLVLYMSPEVMKYQPSEDRSLVRTAPANEIDYFGYRSSMDKSGWDTSYTLKGYKHYKHSGIIGAVFTGIGLAIGTTGAIIIANASHTHDEFLGDTYDAQVGFGVFVTVIGGGLFVAGTVLSATAWPKMQIYKKKLHGLSFDMRYGPKYKELSVLYRF